MTVTGDAPSVLFWSRIVYSTRHLSAASPSESMVYQFGFLSFVMSKTLVNDVDKESEHAKSIEYYLLKV